jgi:hypothetical protein
MLNARRSAALAAWLLLGLSGTSIAQVQKPPSIPKDGDAEVVKVERCRQSLSPQFAWQLGDAKRLREWCRQNGYITYKQQLEAEG